MNEIRLRLKELRLEMIKLNLDAFYISGSDPHSSEYLTERWRTREYITGFTGSFGIIVITQEEAGLWTDSRYFLQAEEQLKGSGIKMFKLRTPDAVSPEEWLVRKLSSGSKVGINTLSVTLNGYRYLNSVLQKKNIGLVKASDLLDRVWKERPENPDHKIFELDVKYAGLSRRNKRELIIAGLKRTNSEFHIITTLDELAWAFNLRGSDIDYNPVFNGYGIVGKTEVLLFVDKTKIPDGLDLKLEKEKIILQDYDRFFEWLIENRRKRFYVDPATVNYAVYDIINSNGNISEGTSMVASLKVRKNEIELQGIERSMVKDGVALTEFLYWLQTSLQENEITEYDAGIKLVEFRSKQEGFIGESFEPIVGYKAHGAIVHLTVGKEDALPLQKDGILLFDSGGQYLHGTTDITRTIALGSVTKQQKKDYTLVLKGMVALTCAKFPFGTKGSNIDILARNALWQNGLNYGHGTGHGVGHFLNVHEGPVSIRQDYNSNDIQPGMIFSNEPGLYRTGEYGIRIENLIVCVEKEENEFGRFLGFETLTLFPIDTCLIERELLTQVEIDWINEYHKMVNEKIKPHLENGHLTVLLDELTQPI